MKVCSGNYQGVPAFWCVSVFHCVEVSRHWLGRQLKIPICYRKITSAMVWRCEYKIIIRSDACSWDFQNVNGWFWCSDNEAWILFPSQFIDSGVSEYVWFSDGLECTDESDTKSESDSLSLPLSWSLLSFASSTFGIGPSSSELSRLFR